MATATFVHSSIESDLARIEFDYDDASNPDDWDLIAARCVNGLDRPVRILIWRPGGQNFFDVQVPAGQTRSMPTGGPVRNMSDLPRIELRA